MSEKGVGTVALVTSTLAGSTYNAFAKPLTGAFSPLSLLFVSEMLMSLFVMLSFGLVPTVRKTLALPRRYWLPLLATGLLSSVLGPMLWFLALEFSSAVKASIFGKVDLIIMMILARFILKEKLTHMHVLAAGIVLFGLLTVSMKGFVTGMQPRATDLIIVASGLCYALGGICYRKYLTKVEVHVTLFVRTLIAVGMFFILSPFLATTFLTELRALPLTLVPALLGFGFLSRFINVFSYYQAVDRLPVMTVSLFTTLDVVGATLFAWLYLGEHIHFYHVIGAACVIAGNVLIEATATHKTETEKIHHLKHRAPHRR